MADRDDVVGGWDKLLKEVQEAGDGASALVDGVEKSQDQVETAARETAEEVDDFGSDVDRAVGRQEELPEVGSFELSQPVSDSYLDIVADRIRGELRGRMIDDPSVPTYSRIRSAIGKHEREAKGVTQLAGRDDDSYQEAFSDLVEKVGGEVGYDQYDDGLFRKAVLVAAKRGVDMGFKSDVEDVGTGSHMTGKDDTTHGGPQANRWQIAEAIEDGGYEAMAERLDELDEGSPDYEALLNDLRIRVGSELDTGNVPYERVEDAVDMVAGSDEEHLF